MKRTLRWASCAVGIPVFVLASCAGEKAEAPAPKVARGVRLQAVHFQSTPLTVEAVGTVESRNKSVLNAQIGGTVREIRVKAGDRVRRGQLLAVLDDRTPQAQLQMARAGVEEATQGLAEIDQALEAANANLKFAESTYKRYQGLLAKNSISPQEFEDAETRYKSALAGQRALEAKKKQVEAKGQQAKSQESSAETFYSYSRIVSPQDGVVTAKSVDRGTVVMPGMPLLTVEDDRSYRLDASVPEEYLDKIKLGQVLPVSTPEGNFNGPVAEIVPASDPASRTFTIKVELPRDCRCRSGEYGKAYLPVDAEKRLAVPQSAVVERGELEGLFVANDQSVLEFRLVKTGKVTGGNVEILSGLNDGERVVVSSTDGLVDGEKVGE